MKQALLQYCEFLLSLPDKTHHESAKRIIDRINEGKKLSFDDIEFIKNRIDLIKLGL